MKKELSPQEVAVEVLKKAQEVLKEWQLKKAENNSHVVELGEEPRNDSAEAPAYLAEADLEDDYKEDESRQTGKKKKKEGEAEGFESEEEYEEEHSKEPEHEKDMDLEEGKEHDAKENQEDELDEDIIEADEEEALDLAEEDDEAVKESKKLAKEKDEEGDEEVEESDEEEDSKKKVKKSEKPSLKKFLAKRKMYKAKVDAGKTADQKKKDRYERNGYTKGINTPIAERTKAGREMAEHRKDTSNPSWAGMQVGRKGPINIQQAKTKAKEVLSELKAMPKPKLPK